MTVPPPTRTARRITQTVIDRAERAEARVAKLEAALAEMELHDNTGDPYDDGYMRAINEMRIALKGNGADS